MTEGQSTVQVDGFTVREVIERLDARYPGLADRLCDGADLRAGIAVAVGHTAIERRSASPTFSRQRSALFAGDCGRIV